MRSASFFLLTKLSERFYLIGLELSIIVLELIFDYKSDWFERMSFKFIVYPKWLFARCFGKNVPPGPFLLVLPYMDSNKAS